MSSWSIRSPRRRCNATACCLAAPELNPTPGELCRRDGQSVYAVHGAERYTSRPLILAVEDRLLAAAGTRTVTATPGPVFDAVALSREAEQGWAFDPGQVAAGSGVRV